MNVKERVYGKYGDNLTYKDELLDIVDKLGGQLLFFMRIDRWDLPLKNRWLDYFKYRFKPDKKFYIIFEEEEFSTHTILDLDKVVEFFEERGVDKDKLIWVTASHNLNDLLKRFNKYIKVKPIPLHYGDSRLNKEDTVKSIIKDKVINYNVKSFGFNSSFYNLKYITDKTFLSEIRTEKTPSKLFCCPMGLEKISRLILLKKMYDKKFIKHFSFVDDDDLGWVSLNSKKRIFKNDISIYDKKHIKVDGMFEGKQFVYSDTPEMLQTFYAMKHIIKDSFIYLNVECEIDDFNIWDNNSEGDLFHWLEKNCSRFVEKIMIPILFKKPFLNLGPLNGLEILKSYGFKTFDSIIDESYDKEVDLDKRMDMVLNEIERLSSVNLNEIKPILDYNYNLLLDMNTNKKKYVEQYFTENINDLYT
jgi:hypothetical protein|tara:strand:+ start:321 stop:1571 length:1251 start_codon:yes stop_codon:yes gene_type:complete